METVNNKFNKLIKVASYLPTKTRYYTLTRILGKYVPYVGTSGLVYEEVSPSCVIVSIKNIHKSRNHIGQVHAVAMILLAESATGVITALNVPDDRVVLIKQIGTQFKKPTKGAMRATATLSDDQRHYILTHQKGELEIPVTITDESGMEPISCSMLWAWIPKAELAHRKKSQT